MVTAGTIPGRRRIGRIRRPAPTGPDGRVALRCQMRQGEKSGTMLLSLQTQNIGAGYARLATWIHGHSDHDLYLNPMYFSGRIGT